MLFLWGTDCCPNLDLCQDEIYSRRTIFNVRKRRPAIGIYWEIHLISKFTQGSRDLKNKYWILPPQYFFAAAEYPTEIIGWSSYEHLRR